MSVAVLQLQKTLQLLSPNRAAAVERLVLDLIRVVSTEPMDELEAPSTKRIPTGFVARWGGKIRKIEGSNDPRIDHINSKHLR
jgi:hypothetical protein